MWKVEIYLESLMPCYDLLDLIKLALINAGSVKLYPGTHFFPFFLHCKSDFGTSKWQKQCAADMTHSLLIRDPPHLLFPVITSFCIMFV